MLPSLWWYVASVPQEILARARWMVWPDVALDLAWRVAAVLALLVLLTGLVRPSWNRAPVAALLMLVGFAWFGSFEWFRESTRKPWAIEAYTYGNGLHAADLDAVRATGLLAALDYRTADPGADLYQRSCGSCHSLGGGYRDLGASLAGMDEEFIAGLVAGSGSMAARMPPFYGTDEDAALVAAHVAAHVDHRPLAEIHGARGRELGQVVWAARCGRCHVVGGPKDVSDSLADMDEMDVEDLLDTAEDYGREMPAFTGDDQERAALVEYLLSFGGAGKGGAS
jgi:mono/diheme cytochrome c family protein